MKSVVTSPESCERSSSRVIDPGPATRSSPRASCPRAAFASGWDRRLPDRRGLGSSSGAAPSSGRNGSRAAAERWSSSASSLESTSPSCAAVSTSSSSPLAHASCAARGWRAPGPSGRSSHSTESRARGCAVVRQPRVLAPARIPCRRGKILCRAARRVPPRARRDVLLRPIPPPNVGVDARHSVSPRRALVARALARVVILWERRAEGCRRRAAPRIPLASRRNTPPGTPKPAPGFASEPAAPRKPRMPTRSTADVAAVATSRAQPPASSSRTRPMVLVGGLIAFTRFETARAPPVRTPSGSSRASLASEFSDGSRRQSGTVP